ncbi:MAG: hypothetical protein KIS78_27265 [Labilithrix sp.]|nr:hypothetical protein [Labilithrix sp.]MCW5836131.1 hypothetical protein [Labilithrix sp.]
MSETKKQITQNPGRDDVHEQRERDQEREGVVDAPEPAAEATPPPPKQPPPRT